MRNKAMTSSYQNSCVCECDVEQFGVELEAGSIFRWNQESGQRMLHKKDAEKQNIPQQLPEIL